MPLGYKLKFPLLANFAANSWCLGVVFLNRFALIENDY